MAALGQVITVGTSATLIFSVLDRESYNLISSPGTNVFISDSSDDPLPIWLIFPASGTVYLGGAGVTASGAGVGAAVSGIPSVAYNCVGGDSLYGVVASSTAAIQLLVLRQ